MDAACYNKLGAKYFCYSYFFDNFYFYLIQYFIYLLIFYSNNSPTILGGIAHNVLAVYDVGAGIKGLCVAKTARPNVPE
jgi:hypothetical protein